MSDTVKMATIMTADGDIDLPVEYDGNDTWRATFPDGTTDTIPDACIVGFWTATRWIVEAQTVSGAEVHYLVYAMSREQAIDTANRHPEVREVVKCLRGYAVSPPNDSAIRAEEGEAS